MLGLAVATVMQRVASRRISSTARAVLFLPQVVPLVAAGIAWSWVLSSSGVVNQVLKGIGLGGVTRPWLGDFGTALPAVGVIGAWVLLGLCTVLLLAGMSKIDPTLYEAAQIDGACGPAAAGPLVIASTCVSRAMSSTGTSIRSDSCRVRPASTMATARYVGSSVMAANCSWMSDS